MSELVKPELTREVIVQIVKEVQQPLHEENQRRFLAIDEARSCDAAALMQANENIALLQANDVRHESRFTRIESNIEALVGSATVQGMIPGIRADLQGEFSRSSTFRHDVRGTLDSVLGRIMLIEKTEARHEGEELGRTEVKKKLADWVKWAAGGLASAIGLFLMDVAKHYILKWR